MQGLNDAREILEVATEREDIVDGSVELERRTEVEAPACGASAQHATDKRRRECGHQ
jgi:hypothetical protein